MCTKIIERNTTIPCSRKQVFSTAADNQTAVDINILQGEREMAKDNKQLGMFKLDGIAPAPRGIPQIEVTFDIDTNGIVHVTAKDLGTGKEQNITITSSSNMSKEDIDKAVKDAERFAAEDKRKREEVDSRNQADQMVFQCRKSLDDFGDKVTLQDRQDVEAKISALEDALKGSDIELINSRRKDLETAFGAVATKVYQQASQNGQVNPEDFNNGGQNAN